MKMRSCVTFRTIEIVHDATEAPRASLDFKLMIHPRVATD